MTSGAGHTLLCRRISVGRTPVTIASAKALRDRGWVFSLAVCLDRDPASC